MEKAYRVVFVYPDGHIEEITELFKSGKEALEYGNTLLGQVHNTEGVINRGASFDDEFGFKEKIDPYFMIVEIKNNKYHLVFDSRGR